MKKQPSQQPSPDELNKIPPPSSALVTVPLNLLLQYMRMHNLVSTSGGAITIFNERHFILYCRKEGAEKKS